MTAGGPGQGAGLAAGALGQTRRAVADAPAAVHVAWQLLVADEAAGDVLQVAGDVAALLMLAHAPLLSEVGTRWTLLLAVAVVEHWVITLVPPGAQILTLRGLGPAGDGGELDALPTVARQLIKTGLPAGLALPPVTELLAAVEPTVELVATDQRALVLRTHAARLATLVPAAGALLAAALLTGEQQLAFIMDACTGDVLAFGATPAADGGGEGAGPTAALVAQLLTQVDDVVGPAGQGFVAGLATGGDGVGTGAAFGITQLQELGQVGLATGAALYQPGGQRARLARPGVAQLLAPVGLALQHLPTQLLTGEVSSAVKVVFISPTENLASDDSTVTHLLDLELAGGALAAVTHLGAGVF